MNIAYGHNQSVGHALGTHTSSINTRLATNLRNAAKEVMMECHFFSEYVYWSGKLIIVAASHSNTPIHTYTDTNTLLPDNFQVSFEVKIDGLDRAAYVLLSLSPLTLSNIVTVLRPPVWINHLSQPFVTSSSPPLYLSYSPAPYSLLQSIFIPHGSIWNDGE